MQTMPIRTSVMKWMRNGIRFTRDSRQRVIIPLRRITTPTTIDSGLAEL